MLSDTPIEFSMTQQGCGRRGSTILPASGDDIKGQTIFIARITGTITRLRDVELLKLSHFDAPHAQQQIPAKAISSS
jgi:hypothetical protein